MDDSKADRLVDDPSWSTLASPPADAGGTVAADPPVRPDDSTVGSDGSTVRSDDGLALTGVAGALRVLDPAQVADGPDADQFYRHHAHLSRSVKELWSRREIVYTLAERDIRATYKQAVLGVGWALLMPVAMLAIFILIFSRVSHFYHGPAPYALWAYLGIVAWQFMSSAIGQGGSSLLSNKQLLNKTHFPRECFPFAIILESCFTTVLAWVPLGILFIYFSFVPKIETLYAPMYMLVELVFAAGVVLAISALVIQARDMVQVLPVVTQLGMFATPVIWPFERIPHNLQYVYGFFNPLGPVISGLRSTILFGLQPDWGVMGVAAVGALLYLYFGYTLFKRLEVHFADVA